MTQLDLGLPPDELHVRRRLRSRRRVRVPVSRAARVDRLLAQLPARPSAAVGRLRLSVHHVLRRRSGAARRIRRCRRRTTASSIPIASPGSRRRSRSICAISRSTRAAAAGSRCAPKRAASGRAATSTTRRSSLEVRGYYTLWRRADGRGAHRVRPGLLAGRQRNADDAPLLPRRAGVASRLQLQSAVAADSVGDAGQSGAARSAATRCS